MLASPIISIASDTHAEHSRHGRVYVFRGHVPSLGVRYFRRDEHTWQTQRYDQARSREWSSIHTVASHSK